MPYRWMLAAVITLGLGSLTVCAAEGDTERISAFLKQRHPGATWDQGPTAITGEPLTIAYPDRRFYYVLTSPKPVSRSGDSELSRVVGVDGNDGLHEVAEAADFNDGLDPKADRQVVVAAVMSLVLGAHGPVTVAPNRISLENGVYTAHAGTTDAPSDLQVTLAPDGRILQASNRFRGPMPICFGATFRTLSTFECGAIGLAGHGCVELVERQPHSVAENADLESGDQVVDFDGRPLPENDPVGYLRARITPLKLSENGGTRVVGIRRHGIITHRDVTWPGEGRGELP